MPGLVLSIFPGIGLLDRAFEHEGFCTVRGPDPIWGGDVRTWHPPGGVFDGVIGGDPCQAHSTLSNLVRAKGLEPRFGDMTSEYARIVSEARPRWFLRENVTRAPDLRVDGYAVHTFVLDNADLDRGDGVGEQQMRRRRFWFGMRCRGEPVDLRRWIRFARARLPFTLHPEACSSASPFQLEHPIARGAPDATHCAASVTGRHSSKGMGSAHTGYPPDYTVGDMLELQGLPRTFMDHAPFSAQGKRRAIGNGVPQSMGRALAAAVREAIAQE